MKRQVVIALGLGFVLLAGMISPAAAENDSLHVIMAVEDRNYSVGDTVTLQLRIYNSGTLADATSIYAGVSTNHNFNNPTNLTMSKSGTGIYSGTYTVKAADSNRNLYFFHDVTLGNDHEGVTSHNDALAIPVYSIQDTVDISICGQEMVPAKSGDVLTATILTRTGSSPIPISGFTELYVETPAGETHPLNYTEVQTGVYNVFFTVPQTSVSGMYEIVAQPMDMWDEDSVEIYVNVLDVWYHKLSASGSTVSFEICVADMTGAAVEGANYFIERIGWPYDAFSGVTNASGKALLHVPDIEGSEGFSGYVLAAGLNQTVYGLVYNPAAQTPHHSDFDIIWEGTETLFEPGDSVTVPYGAYDSQIPAALKTIHYYVTARGTDFALLFDEGSHVETAREVLVAGTLTTDSLGKFSVAFEVPDEQCAIELRLEVPLQRDNSTGPSYDLDDDWYYEVFPENPWNDHGFVFYAFGGNLDGDGEVSIGGSFDPGEWGSANIKLSANAGDPTSVLWGVGEWSLDSIGTMDPEWMNWVPAGYAIRLEQTESGKYQGSFLVPEFLEGHDITIIAGYMDTADGTPHFDAKKISPGGGFPWFWVILAVIIVLAVIVLIFVMKERM